MLTYSGLCRAVATLLLPCVSATLAWAVDTTVWQQDTLTEFSRGTKSNLSVRSDGQLSLSPSFRQIADLATPYLWTVVEDSKGVLYCAGGAPTAATAKVFAVTPDGKSRTIAELSGLEIHSLAVDRHDRLYAATSPDSKIYRIDGTGKTELIFDTKAKYVWAMATDSDDNLYVATGDQGVIYKVSSDGKAGEFFRTEETHARSMIIDHNGDLIVGTEPGGYVIRITPSGKSFVLFQTDKREVTALAEHEGKLYAAATGSHPVVAPVLPVPAASAPAGAANPVTRIAVPAQPQQQGAAPAARPPTLVLTGNNQPAGGADFYVIEADGFGQKLWSSPTDVVYAIAFDRGGKPLLGTGNRGIIYRVDSQTQHTQLVNAPPTQITAFLQARSGILYAVTGNVGELFALGPNFEKTGSIESEVLDAGSFAYWGKAHLKDDLHQGKAELSTRSGNVNRPQKNWSDWTPVDVSEIGGQVKSPPARFLQYRLTLKAADSGEAPTVDTVQMAYLPRNIAPVVRVVEVEEPNYRSANTPTFLERTLAASGSPTTLTLPALGVSRMTAPILSTQTVAGMTLQYAKGFETVRWLATDANDDSFTYRVEIQRQNESVWRLLKDKLTESHYSFDSSAFADGQYRIRIVASDAPSNTTETALTGSLVSELFMIDNTPAEITSMSQKQEATGVVFRFQAIDALSWIDKAEYSINGGDWALIEPLNRVSDSRQLTYELRVPKMADGTEQVVAVRVFDESDNEAVRQFVVPPK